MITVYSDDPRGFWWVTFLNMEELETHPRRMEILRRRY